MNLPDPQTLLAHLPPFSQLPEPELARLAEELIVGHFQPGDVLLETGETPAGLYIVIDGAVWEVDDGATVPHDTLEGSSDALLCVVSHYTAEDLFDAKALLEGASPHRFIASEPTRCFQLPRAAFLRTVQAYPQLATFYRQGLSQRLAALRAAGESQEQAAFTVAKIQDVYLHPPVFVGADASLHEAALAMKANRTHSVLVQRGEDLGIITTTDLRDAALVRRQPVDQPVGPLASYSLIGMAPDDFLFNALLRMTQHNVNRLVIRRGDTIHGVLEQVDLLSYLSNHSHLIALQVERATSKEDLQWASRDLVNVVRDLHGKGIKIHYIMQLVSELNKKVLRKLFEILAPPELAAQSCLLVMGSEGREEQVLKTDQDNALILRDGFDHRELESFTRTFTDSLLEFGYPRCPGDIMVSNPAWAKSVTAFKKDLFQWIVHPTYSTFLQFAIFYDAMAVAGDDGLLEDVKDRMYALLSDHDAFYSQFAKATIAFETPLGFFTNFVVEKHRDELDIKKGGIFPIVHGVRSLALEYRLPQTHTVDRIKALDQKSLFAPSFGIELSEAFSYMSTLRVQAGLDKVRRGLPQDNYLNPKKLNKLERELLRDSFKIVNEFKKFIGHHFKLGMIT
ncbi:MAG: cyclic nucleotide-binding/CBS domain-containing protein [Candidatus Competibacteraceae bacterium]|nr:MAG: cyclic nucleotide-binding/CBS domain-containing protein [Candidatus Competibacteraceae bacterium]